jgi:DNA-binding CsgD family transcriptional regulator
VVAERLAELGILRSADAVEPLPLTDAIEAGWRHREREAIDVASRQSAERRHLHAHFVALAGDQVTTVREGFAALNDWYVSVVRKSTEVISAVPAILPHDLRQLTVSHSMPNAVEPRSGLAMRGVVDVARVAQFRERHYLTVVDAVSPYTMGRDPVPLRMSVVDEELTLMQANPDDVDTIMVVRSRQFARIVKTFILASSGRTLAVETPMIDGETSHVLRLLAQGATDEAIARRLGVSDRTVRRIVSGLMERLEARSRFQLAVRASGAGLI